jgi:hypothetical protein
MVTTGDAAGVSLEQMLSDGISVQKLGVFAFVPYSRKKLKKRAAGTASSK